MANNEDWMEDITDEHKALAKKLATPTKNCIG